MDLNTNGIGVPGATALADALMTNSALQSLNLSFNKIGNAGATAFAKALKTNSTLTLLNVEGNYIGTPGVVAFADTLETNTTLTAVKLLERHSDASYRSAIASVGHRTDANKRSKLLAAPATEALVMFASSQNSYFPSEVGALIVQSMITLAPGQGDGVQGLESLVYESAIAKQRELDKKG